MSMREKTPLYKRIWDWIRQRLIEGFEALTAYRWARVMLGFFAFVWHKMMDLAAWVPEKVEFLKSYDMDRDANTYMETFGKRAGGKIKKVYRRLYGAYSLLYQKHRMSVKMILTTLLLVLSMVLVLLDTNRTTALMCAGMGFSWLADAMLMGYPPVRRGFRQYFLWGMGGFACAQIAYTSAFMNVYAKTQGADGLFVYLGTWGIFALAGALIWLACIAFNHKQLAVLRVGTLVYAMLVSAMTAAACVVAISTTGRVWWLIPGAIFFYISDMMIALFDFGSVKVKHPDGWIWLFYAPAQLLLITGACAAAAI